jgi:WD40 repeat protein
LFLLSLATLISASAQQAASSSSPSGACAVPPFSRIVNERNIFNEQQEEWLGEIIDPKIRKTFHTFDDPEGNYLEKIGDRLLAQLPPTKIHYTFTIINLPDNNSFGLAGGHIYLSRRVIALAQNEDELAGLLAHEIGHIVTRQNTIDMTREFQRVLGVNEVGDRNDILDKWNRWLDSIATKPSKFDEKREQQEQLIADRIALYAMTRAGYQPSRFVDFFDRLAQTKGNKGNFLSDLFSTTSPESKRLRELVRNAAPLPPECITPLAGDPGPHFLEWQQSVAESGFAVAKEDVPGLIRKTPLNPPLRGDLNLVQFSPDGKYVLAQDQGSIYVLSREPLTNLFRIDAPDASAAKFTPDSAAIVFSDAELRVEKWEIAGRRRLWARQLTLTGDCRQMALSPSGAVMACLSAPVNFTNLVAESSVLASSMFLTFELRLIDVATNQTLLTRELSCQFGYSDLVILEILDSRSDAPRFAPSGMHFSPDAHYFATGCGNAAFAYDLTARKEVSLPGRVKTMLGGHFVFKGSDEIDGFDNDGSKPRLIRLRFPSGDLIDRFDVQFRGELAAPPQGEYLLLLHVSDVPAALIELQKKRITTRFETSGIGIYGEMYAAETAGGAMALRRFGEDKNLDQTRMPYGPLHGSRVTEFSSNGKWLAISERNRGAIWEIETGQRLAFIVGFEGGFFDNDNLLAKFPKHANDPPRVNSFDLARKTQQTLYRLDPPDAGAANTDSSLLGAYPLLQVGPLLVKIGRSTSGTSKATLSIEAYDVHNNKKIWERSLKHATKLFFSKPSSTLALLSRVEESDLENAALKARLKAIPAKDGRRDAYLLSVVDARNGNSVGSLLINTGHRSFSVLEATVAGDTVLLVDSDDRTLIYSLKSGEEKGRVFGQTLALSQTGDKAVVQESSGEVTLYDLSGVQPVAHFTFPRRAVRAEFSEDGATILLLTEDQLVYHLKASAETNAAQQ